MNTETQNTSWTPAEWETVETLIGDFTAPIYQTGLPYYDKEDLQQDVALKLWENRPPEWDRFDRPQHALYIRRTIIRRLLDVKRFNRARPVDFVPLDGRPEISDGRPGPDAAIDRLAIQQALSKAPADVRDYLTELVNDEKPGHDTVRQVHAYRFRQSVMAQSR
jgi:DNA-directed RNA polymerase specialized sigma24 family protein